MLLLFISLLVKNSSYHMIFFQLIDISNATLENKSFVSYSHWMLSSSLTTQHMLAIISISNTLMEMNHTSFISEFEDDIGKKFVIFKMNCFFFLIKLNTRRYIYPLLSRYSLLVDIIVI